jgi:hypothetical protein
MSEKVNDGGCAFPIAYKSGDDSLHIFYGMTLRDYFAGQAINGFVSTNNWLNDSDPLNIAKRAYRIADAMIEARGQL